MQGVGCEMWGVGGGDENVVIRVEGSGFKVSGSRFRVWGSAWRVQGSGMEFQGSEFRVQGFALGEGATSLEVCSRISDE